VRKPFEEGQQKAAPVAIANKNSLLARQRTIITKVPTARLAALDRGQIENRKDRLGCHPQETSNPCGFLLAVASPGIPMDWRML